MSSVDISGPGFVETEYTFPLLKRPTNTLLADLSALIVLPLLLLQPRLAQPRLRPGKNQKSQMRTWDFGVFNKSLQSEINLRNMKIKAYLFGRKNEVEVLQRWLSSYEHLLLFLPHSWHILSLSLSLSG